MIVNARDEETDRDPHVIVLHGPDRESLLQQAAQWHTYLLQERDLRGGLSEIASHSRQGLSGATERVAIVAATVEELIARLARTMERLRDARCRTIHDVSGIYYTDQPIQGEGKLAVLFPGEASQYAGMIAGLAERFPSVTNVFDGCRAAARHLGRSSDELLDFVTNSASSVTAERFGSAATLNRDIDYGMALHSVLITNWVLYGIMQELGIGIDVMAGHSAGEFSVLSLSGIVDSEVDLFQLVTSLNEMTASDKNSDKAMLLAVGTSAAKVEQLLSEHLESCESKHGIFVAMDNCPHQTVVVGIPQAVSQFEQILRDHKLICERLPLDRPYHTPLFGPYMEPMRQAMRSAQFNQPRLPIYSATTASLFPDDPHAIRELAVAHWASPVRFTDMVRTMYDAGVRVFIESGPRGNLHAFVQDTLRGRRFLSIAMNVMNRSPYAQINHAIAQLIAHHIPVRAGLISDDRQSSQVTNSPAVDARQITVATTHPPQPASSLLQFQQVMHNFLDVQHVVMQQYLAMRRGGHAAQAEAPAWAHVSESCDQPNQIVTPSNAHPLLGQIIEHLDGERIVTRRPLDLELDPYAHHHAVGGRDVSEVDPLQHGLPVVPMTFTLETMAALARALFPQLRVLRIEDVRLHRWLAYHEHDPTTSEAVAIRIVNDHRDSQADAEQVRVRIEIRDLGNRESGSDGPKVAAIGDVIMSPGIPVPPQSDIRLSNPRASRLTLERLYHNLFHGSRFHGVQTLDGFGDNESIGTIHVLPRDNLFSFDSNPQFEFDPVLLDVAMHIMAGWHLEHDDQLGRLTLPFKLDSIEFFGNCPPVGTQFEVRTRTTRETSRQFCHDVDLIDGQGNIYARYRGIRLWRFYLPVGEVNFHGPKNIYYLSDVWDEARPSTPCQSNPSPWPVTCMRLVPPSDLVQPAMLWAASKVMLSDNELRQYVQLGIADADKVTWLFARAAMKEAVRKLWEREQGRRMFAADVEIMCDAAGRWYSQARNQFLHGEFPRLGWGVHHGMLVAVAALRKWPGVAIAAVGGSVDDQQLGTAAVQNAVGTTEVGVSQLAATVEKCRRAGSIRYATFEGCRVATCLVDPTELPA